jgi:hypothetical protein
MPDQSLETICQNFYQDLVCELTIQYTIFPSQHSQVLFLLSGRHMLEEKLSKLCPKILKFPRCIVMAMHHTPHRQIEILISIWLWSLGYGQRQQTSTQTETFHGTHSTALWSSSVSMRFTNYFQLPILQSDTRQGDLTTWSDQIDKTTQSH